MLHYLNELVMPTSNGIQAMTREGYTQYLQQTAAQLYAKGWTVVGSRFKESRLHPWGESTKEALYQWAMADLGSTRANSINLRLRDSGVVALDCDVYDPLIMKEFLSMLSLLTGINVHDFYTTAGGKGCKVFFRYQDTSKPSANLAGAWCGGIKSAIEVKTHLSTVVGLYNEQWAVYHPLEGCRFICDAAPSDLPIINGADLRHLKRIFLEMCADMGYTHQSGELILKSWIRNNILPLLAKFDSTQKQLAAEQANGVTADCRLTTASLGIRFTAPWLGFFKLQGSRVYKELIEACFFDQWPNYKRPTFLACQDLIQEFWRIRDNEPRLLESYINTFDHLYFREYAEYLSKELASQGKRLYGDSYLSNFFDFYFARRAVQC